MTAFPTSSSYLRRPRLRAAAVLVALLAGLTAVPVQAADLAGPGAGAAVAAAGADDSAPSFTVALSTVNPTFGQTLHPVATGIDLDDPSLTVQYAWRSGDEVLSTGRTYTVTRADAGRTLSVHVTAAGLGHGRGGEAAAFALPVPELAVVRGRLLETAGVPAVGATVSLCDAEGPLADVAPVQTDAAGRWQLVVVPGSYCLEMTVRNPYAGGKLVRFLLDPSYPLNRRTVSGEPDYVRAAKYGFRSGTNENALNDVYLDPDVYPHDNLVTGSVEGHDPTWPREIDYENGELSGATVTLFPADRDGPDENGEGVLRTTTDGDGAWLLEDVRQGHYKVRVSHPEHHTRWAGGDTWETAATVSVFDSETIPVGQVRLRPVVGPDVTGSHVTMAGQPVVGRTLTAVTGAWGPSGVELSYAWYADGEWIAGADEPSFTVTSAQVGRRITVSVTGTQHRSRPATVTSAPTAAVWYPLDVGRPTVTGAARYGATLTAKPGGGTPGVRLTYTWRANGAPIPGATKSTYKVGAVAVGKRVTVTVTGTRSLHLPSSATSAATGVVKALPMVGAKPKLSGTGKVRTVVKAKPGRWTKGARLTYQWLLDGKPVARATKSRFRPPASARRHRLSVRVTGTRAGYATLTRKSATIRLR